MDLHVEAKKTTDKVATKKKNVFAHASSNSTKENYLRSFFE